jgi:hypothetical protein
MPHPFEHFRELPGTWVVSVISKSGDEQIVAQTSDAVEAYEALDDVLLLSDGVTSSVEDTDFATVALTYMIPTG